MTDQIRLAAFAAESGAAAQRGPCDLRAVPDELPRSSPLSGRMLETCDDTTVKRVLDDLCLVHRVGLFSAIVDTPYWSFEASLVGPLMVEALA